MIYKVSKKQTFKALAMKARQTRDSGDTKQALDFGITNNISAAKIRKALNGDFDF